MITQTKQKNVPALFASALGSHQTPESPASSSVFHRFEQGFVFSCTSQLATWPANKKQLGMNLLGGSSHLVSRLNPQL